MGGWKTYVWSSRFSVRRKSNGMVPASICPDLVAGVLDILAGAAPGVAAVEEQHAGKKRQQGQGRDVMGVFM